jgi:hypothetical protein
MNNEQIFAIISQGLNKANKSGVFDLKESASVVSALSELQKVLDSLSPKEEMKKL